MFDHRIETFLVAATTLNFTTAAKHLFITQPAVSTHIHQLEEEYQTKFFKQVGKQVQLTENGKLFFEVASRMKNDDRHMRQSFATTANQFEFNFGTTHSIADYCLQNPLQKLWKTYPNLHLSLSVQNTKTLLKRIQQGTLDFAIIEGYYSKDVFDSIPFQTQDYIPVCHPSHQFLRPISSIQDLRGEPLLIREKGSGTRETLERFLSANELDLQDFHVKAEIESLQILKQCVEADIGITFFFRPVIQKELNNHTLKQIHIKETLCHTFSYVWAKQSVFAKQYQKIGMILSDT